MLAFAMRRITVNLSEDLDTLLRREVQRRGMTIAEIMRAALEAHLDDGWRRRLEASAAGRSGRSYISERVEEIISSELSVLR
jgi:hypothetical protein